MTWRPFESEDPDRLYTITGGRSRADETSLDLVTLIVGECDPAPGMQSEHVRILEMCHRPVAVVEISADLGLPVSIVKILLCDLLDTGQVTARHPASELSASSALDAMVTDDGVSPASPVSAPASASSSAPASMADRLQLPDPEILKQVLIGLQNL